MFAVNDIQERYRALIAALEEVARQAKLLQQADNASAEYVEFARYFLQGSLSESAARCAGAAEAARKTLINEQESNVQKLNLLPDFASLQQKREKLLAPSLRLVMLLKKSGAQNAERISGVLLQDGAAAEISCYSEELARLSEKATDPKAFRRFYTLVKKSSDVQKISVNKAVDIRSIAPGQMIYFGTYPQTKDGNDRTPIEWLVLDVDRNMHKVLLVSRYALDAKPYNTDYADVTWEKCTLRKWLNNEFMNIVFSEEEKDIVKGTYTATDKSPYVGMSTNKSTQDKVFLLSTEEISIYFKNEKERFCIPTEYAVSLGVHIESQYRLEGKSTCCWWLRSSGSNRLRAVGIFRGGKLCSNGNFVNYPNNAVRPALWVEIK